MKQYERSRCYLIPSGVCWPFVNWLHFHAGTFNKVAKCQWLQSGGGLPPPGSALRRHSNIHEQFTCLFSCKILQSLSKMRKHFGTVQLISGRWACTARSGLRSGSCDSSHWRNESQHHTPRCSLFPVSPYGLLWASVDDSMWGQS